MNDLTRRAVVAGAAVAAASGSPALAQNAPQEKALQNPLDKYPKPPFENQKQEWPGLASKMNPKPDHGEESYKGSGRLSGRKALITGGDSGMGRGAAPTSNTVISETCHRLS